MNITKIIPTLGILGGLVLSGCSTPVDQTFEFDTEDFAPLMQSEAVNTVYVHPAKDIRQFVKAESTIHPEQMTYSSYTTDASYTKSHIVARGQTAASCTSTDSVAGCSAEATTFSSLAENICFKEYPAAHYIEEAVKRGFEDAGYRILTRNTDVNKYTTEVTIKVEKFWYWVDYQGEDRHVHTDIIVAFDTVDHQSGAKHSFRIKNHYQTKVLGFMSPLKGTVNSALTQYADTIKKNINKSMGK